MSEHLLIQPKQLYMLYSVQSIKEPYHTYDFLPDYTSFDVDIIYDIINCQTVYELHTILIFIYKQWSLLHLDEEVHTLSTVKRRKRILSKVLSHDRLTSKDEFNDRIKSFINDDNVFGLYVINQLLKLLYPCNV